MGKGLGRRWRCCVEVEKKDWRFRSTPTLQMPALRELLPMTGVRTGTRAKATSEGLSRLKYVL